MADSRDPGTAAVDSSVSFIVTGFGPFQNAAENPTTILARKLVEYLQQQEKCYGSSSALSIQQPRLSAMTQTLVIETAAGAVHEQVDALYKTISTLQANTITIVLHLGVNYRGKQFQVERCAYNEADFRIPDERGHQPRQQPVVNKFVTGQPLETLLNVSALVACLNATDAADIMTTTTQKDKADHHQESAATTFTTTTTAAVPLAVVSTDPGRFVCNYIYCYSLDKFQCSTKVASTETKQQPSSANRVLFLHVPPFEVCSEPVQLRVVSKLMHAIYEQVLGLQ